MRLIDLNKSVVYCNNLHCDCIQHRDHIDLLCNVLIESCIKAGTETIPQCRSNFSAREIPGWSEQVEPERDRSLFWHWMWVESGKPHTGVVYDVMKKAMHIYHCAVQSSKNQTLETQTQNICTANIE